MDAVITQIANTVTTKLKAAKQAITDGKKEIDDFVMKLPKDLEDVGKEAASNIQDRFDALEQTVNDKREQLIDGLAQKYLNNVKKLDERINELKEANKGLIAKAIGYLKEVWKVIRNLYELFKTILSRLVSIIGIILDDPGAFFANVGAAFKQGFDRFESRLEEHLENGLMVWLGTQLGVIGLRIPAKFDVSALFSLALQVMGITPKHIRERAVIIMGEERVAMMETTAGVFQKIMSGNLEVIWDEIKEKFTDFKQMIWEAIKSFIKNAVIKAAFIFLLSLLSPVAAFVKACMAIYDFLMTLVRMKDCIIELLDSILNAVMLISSGAVDKAAEAIEMALARSIPVIIGFLAAILHLNAVGDKTRGIILGIQKQVEKLIDWMITKIYGLMRPVIEAAMRTKNKGKQMIEKGKEKALVAGANLLNWLGVRQSFTAHNGERHTLFIEEVNGRLRLMMASRKDSYERKVENIEIDASDGIKVEAKRKALEMAKEIDTILNNRDNETADPKQQRKIRQRLDGFINTLADETSKILPAEKATQSLVVNEGDLIQVAPNKFLAVIVKIRKENDITYLDYKSHETSRTKATGTQLLGDMNVKWWKGSLESAELNDKDLQLYNSYGKDLEWPGIRIARAVLNYRRSGAQRNFNDLKQWEHKIEHSTGRPGINSAMNLFWTDADFNGWLGEELGRPRQMEIVEGNSTRWVSIRDYLALHGSDAERIHVKEKLYRLRGYKEVDHDDPRGVWRELRR